MHLGSWKIDDYLTFPANLHDPETGGESDADADPTYRIYEDETGTPVVNGTLAVLDTSNTTGFYTERLQLTAGSGFEAGKSYTIFLRGVVGGVAATMSHTFQIGAAVSVELWRGSQPNTLTSGRVEVLLGAVTAGVIAAASFASNALDAVWSTAARVLTAATNLTTALATPTNITAAAGVTLSSGGVGAVADQVWDEATAGHATAGSYGDKFGAHLAGVLKALLTSGSTTTTLVLNATTGIDGGAPSSVDDFYNGAVFVFTSGALAGQRTSISDYNGTTKTLTIVAVTSSAASGVTGLIV